MAGGPGPPRSSPASVATRVSGNVARNPFGDGAGRPAEVSPPSWSDPLFPRTYRYGDASMVLPMEELSR